ncbi:hypothetical protein [Paenibacillus amylolyticus]|uniref:Transcriptional regulator n=1 Tax=Paenibacillus amylolyticus TaxID=1451 RepID=A0A100VLK7_PAEAM|nr:hypothetical protein [Paenibacillus amylolyticus]GAS82092.1 transcriptional regulator [Paenibacillus amylolyticus]
MFSVEDMDYNSRKEEVYVTKQFRNCTIAAAELHTRYKDRKGCLGIHVSLADSDEAEPIRRALIDAHAQW